jgi:dolichol-phosphate mannosyltransferase
MSLSQNQPSNSQLSVENQSSRRLVSIILATYNESENIADMLHAIFAAVPDPIEIIVVDDNSPDQTWKIAQEFGDARVKVIRRLITRGLASAINRGIIESRGDFIGWMDSDMCHPPSMLPAMLESLNSSDVVIGSRYIDGGKDSRNPSRVLSSQLVNRLAGLVLGQGIRDYDSGFILMHRYVLDSVSLNPSGYGAYFIELMYACRRKGLKVVEIPYTFTERQKGISKSNVNLIQFGMAGFGYITRILRTRFTRFD